MAKKFYVIWSGRRTGVFTDWSDVQPLVEGFAGARHKSFPTRAEAEAAFRAGKPATASRPRKTGIKTAKKTANETASAAATAEIRIYCDGACEPNPGSAGSGIVVYAQGALTQLWYGLYHQGTNNTAELNALQHALLLSEQAIRDGHTVDVLSDSKYAINCISVWAPGWEANGWRKASGEIRNLDIIQDTYKIYTRIQDEATLHHVSAHVGTEGNELADRMAMYAVLSKQKELKRYEGELDVATILKMRSG